MADRCKHECRTERGGIVGCALEVGHVLPHESESGHKWVTAHWGPPSPACDGCGGTGQSPVAVPKEYEPSTEFCAKCLGTGRAASKPECARCTELAGHLKVALERIDELERAMP